MVQCGVCSRSFVNAQALLSHCSAKGHKASCSNSYYCRQCKRYFPHSRALQQHINDSPVHQSYCRSCNRMFGDRQSLNQHLNTSSRHSRSVVLYRGSAGRNAVTNRSSSSTYNTHYVDCPICHKSFAAPSAIAQHIESGVCTNISRHQVTATVHSLRIIPTISIPRRLEDGRASTSLTIRTLATPRTFNGRAFICFLCSKGFRSLDGLNAHLNSPAHDRNQFKCPKCKKKVKLVSGLIQHIESGACGIAGFQQVVDLAAGFMNGFTKRLMITA